MPIEILNQIPISKNNTIQIVLEEKGSVEFSEDIGKLFWPLNIDLRQTKKRISRHVIKIVAFN